MKKATTRGSTEDEHSNLNFINYVYSLSKYWVCLAFHRFRSRTLLSIWTNFHQIFEPRFCGFSGIMSPFLVEIWDCETSPFYMEWAVVHIMYYIILGFLESSHRFFSKTFTLIWCSKYESFPQKTHFWRVSRRKCLKNYIIMAQNQKIFDVALLKNA